MPRTDAFPASLVDAAGSSLALLLVLVLLLAPSPRCRVLKRSPVRGMQGNRRWERHARVAVCAHVGTSMHSQAPIHPCRWARHNAAARSHTPNNSVLMAHLCVHCRAWRGGCLRWRSRLLLPGSQGTRGAFPRGACQGSQPACRLACRPAPSPPSSASSPARARHRGARIPLSTMCAMAWLAGKPVQPLASGARACTARVQAVLRALALAHHLRHHLLRALGVLHVLQDLQRAHRGGHALSASQLGHACWHASSARVRACVHAWLPVRSAGCPHSCTTHLPRHAAHQHAQPNKDPPGQARAAALLGRPVRLSRRRRVVGRRHVLHLLRRAGLLRGGGRRRSRCAKERGRRHGWSPIARPCPCPLVCAACTAVEHHPRGQAILTA